MKGWQASDRWGCSHHAPDVCNWCANPDAEVWRDVSDYVPTYGLPAAPIDPVPTLAEWIDKNFEGFWERGATS